MRTRKMNNKVSGLPIGIFDSGIGGLTVAREIFKQLPCESVIYFGDTAHLPYGTKSKAAVKLFSSQILGFLLSKKVKMIVVACNTASALAIPDLKKKIKVPIITVLEPGVKKALEMTRNKRIGVIGTTGTINSRAYQKLLIRGNNRIKIFSKDCPLFVPLVEEGWANSSNVGIIKQVAQVYLKEMKKSGIDTLILGCTHYPLIKDSIGEVMGSKVKLIDSGSIVAKHVSEYLLRENLESRNKKPVYTFYVSDAPEKFANNREYADRKAY